MASCREHSSFNQVGEVSIGQLRSMYRGEPVVLPPVAIRGYVTSSDIAGNMFNTLLLYDGSGVVEIRHCVENTWSSHPLGGEVWVNCTSWVLDNPFGSIMTLSLENDEPLSYWDFKDNVVAMEGKEAVLDTIAIEEFRSEDVGRCFYFKGLKRVSEQYETWANVDEGKMIDVAQDGSNLKSRIWTNYVAEFAADEVPVTKFDMIGVLKYNYQGYYIQAISNKFPFIRSF